MYSKTKFQIMRKGLRFSTVLLAVMIFSLTKAFSQSSTISGHVTDSSTKEGIPAVSVTVKDGTEGTFTDENGNFSITVKKLPAVLIFSYQNYEMQEVTVTTADQNVQVNFVPNYTPGQEIIVSASRLVQRSLDAPVTVERLGGGTLKSIPAPSYYEAIANLKGVDMHTASITFRTVTTRGFISSGNTRLNQLIDGMDNQAPGLNFSVGSVVGLTELDVDNIELLSGASSALYGSGGMNGTLLINSKNPFKYKGLSFQIKQGIMHINDPGGQKPSPYYDWSMRYAKSFNDKFAFKIAGEFIKATDWQAYDYRNVQRNNVISKVIGGDRSTDPNFDGVNIYGDQISQNMLFIAQATQAGLRAGIIQAGGPDVIPILNTLPAIPSAAQVNAFVSAFPAGPAQAAAAQIVPVYFGLRNNWFPATQNVSRTGYEEKYLVDYNTVNFKFTAGLHYMIKPGIEASLNTYFGTGTTVYTGADRYSLRNLEIAQHKLEVKAKNWFVRGYTTN
jgi:outer membrane receptor protein involved in Fe transport